MAETLGFSVFELLAGITLLGLIAAGIAPVLLVGLSTASASREITKLTVAASDRLESLVSQPFHSAELAAGGSLDSSEAGFSIDPLDGNPDRYVRWQVVDETPLMKRIRVAAGTRRTMTGLDRDVLLSSFKVACHERSEPVSVRSARPAGGGHDRPSVQARASGCSRM